MTILAIDTGAVLGYAIADGDVLQSGTRSLKPGRGNHHPSKALNLWSMLTDFHAA